MRGLQRRRAKIFTAAWCRRLQAAATSNISQVARAALDEAGTALDEIGGVAVTFAPGLIGAVLVGLNFAKGLALSAQKPLIPVHHLRGHIAALYLTHPELEPPFLCLVASGGHSHIVRVQDYTHFEVLGRTVDDAAGEAFDKVARTLGLGYPGGPAVSRAAQTGDSKAYPLPTPHVEGPYNVSFSGLKTAVLNLVNKAQMKGERVNVADMAASFQFRITDILAEKAAAGRAGYRRKADLHRRRRGRQRPAAGDACRGREAGRAAVSAGAPALRRQRRHGGRTGLLRIPGGQYRRPKS